MVAYKFFIIVFFILFLLHSLKNVFDNIVNVKTATNDYDVQLNSMDFPLQLFVIVEPGICVYNFLTVVLMNSNFRHQFN